MKNLPSKIKDEAMRRFKKDFPPPEDPFNLLLSAPDKYSIPSRYRDSGNLFMCADNEIVKLFESTFLEYLEENPIRETPESKEWKIKKDNLLPLYEVMVLKEFEEKDKVKG